ncbi:MAG: BrnA antitoxin family protein [Acidobacteria bacterium]|nr:BrnA antitoxin family protein [Acidobacteriota bacterium]
MPRLSAEKWKKLEILAARPNREINLSDIPEIREIPSDHVIGKFYRPKKETVTIRLDADVLAWLKSTGSGYQTRINNFLRLLMQRNRTR